MGIADELKESQNKLQNVSEQINALEQQKQGLLQELLRLDGEVRVLKRMNTKKKE